MNVVPISSPLRGEHLATTSPAMAPETVPDWHQRLNFWAGRALTADALEIEQEHRASHLAWHGRLPTPGIVNGLEIALEEPPKPAAALAAADHFIHVLPGYGLTAYGEDVVVPRPLRIALEKIPVRYVRFAPTDAQAPMEPRPDQAIGESTPLDFGGTRVVVDQFEKGYLPWAGVLLARPAEYPGFGKFDPDDPCEIDLSRDAFADERRNDATALWLLELPLSYEKNPLLGDDQRRRNQLAYAIFEAERFNGSRQFLRALGPAGAKKDWSVSLTNESILPWEFFGVPLGLLSSEKIKGDRRRFFLDRAAVVRQGGRARTRSRPSVLFAIGDNEPLPLPPPAGTPAFWRARVDQFAEQLAGLSEIAVNDQADHFRFVPPVGLLPRGAIEFLTTEEATVPGLTGPGQAPDRAALSKFFPATIAVEAVPIPTEDLDAALASSAPLAPFDFAAKGTDLVRVLVPVPQRLFDPRLLIVELEDPFFATEILRLVALRQDWRERRVFQRVANDTFRQIIAGGPGAPAALLEPGQLEPEPLELELDTKFADGAYVSPKETPGPHEISAGFTAAGTAIDAKSVLYVRLRIDVENPPRQIEMRWLSADQERFRFAWTEPSLPLVERVAPDGTPLAVSLWRFFTVSAADLGASSGDLSKFTLHLDEGRVALSEVGLLGPQNQPVIWWKAGEAAPEGVTFSGGAWTHLTGAFFLMAPFEERIQPIFDDDVPLEKRMEEIQFALNPPAATPRTKPVNVLTHGLEGVLAELDAEADEADDFVDANFLRAQADLYRIRKLLLGQTAAQKLLINPALATIVEQETASASADQLNSYLTQARKNVVTQAAARAALGITAQGAPPPAPPSGTAAGPGATARTVTEIATSVPLNTAGNLNINLAGSFFSAAAPVEATRKFTIPDLAGIIKGQSLKDILGQLPESGPVLPPRGLSIGERFKEPPATQNLSFARSALTSMVGQLSRLRLPLLDETVQSLAAEEVSLLDLQGRAMPASDAAGKKTTAVSKLLKATVSAETDEAEITLAAIDLVEVRSAILRTIERVIQRRRSVIQRGRDTLAAIRAAAEKTEARLAVIAGPLAETRHDVSVARALRQEEQERVNAINTRRDALIRDEVNFLAYVRPRTVDLVRRNLPGWKLEAADTPAPIPACLQRHDQPPDPLRAYVQLFRHGLASWFPDIAPRLRELDTPEKLSELLVATQRSALLFSTEQRVAFASSVPSVATKNALLSAFSIVEASRTRASNLKLLRPELRSWKDFHQEVERHSSLGDIISGRHGHPKLARAAADLLQQIEEVATCLHAEFAAVPPAIRLTWVERYSQFDRPAPLDNLTTLPRYGSLDRPARRRFQAFSDWLFARVNRKERDAFNLINDLVRICLLLASHAPVKSLIAGHLPRPVPVRPGGLIPVHALDPRLVRVGMEVHVWQANTIVARARVEDLQENGEVSARVERLQGATTTLDETMRVQFVPAAFGFSKTIRLT